MTDLERAESEMGGLASAKLRSNFNSYSPNAAPEQFRHMQVDVGFIFLQSYFSFFNQREIIKTKKLLGDRPYLQPAHPRIALLTICQSDRVLPDSSHRRIRRRGPQNCRGVAHTGWNFVFFSHICSS